MQKPTAALLTIISIASRLIPHPANFTTVGATSLFAGSKLDLPWRFIIPLVVMITTDLIIGWHNTVFYVYFSFLISILIGQIFLKGNQSYSRLAVVAVANSTIFFLVTNFGVWQSGGLYPPTPAGLIESYLMGIPFWRNMLLGDVLFTVGFFKLYQLAEQHRLTENFDKKILLYITGK